jgi:hypothetical protein
MASQRRFRSIVWAEKIARVVEGHEDEDESFQKTFDLLGRVPALAGLYVNTVNCLRSAAPLEHEILREK